MNHVDSVSRNTSRSESLDLNVETVENSPDHASADCDPDCGDCADCSNCGDSGCHCCGDSVPLESTSRDVRELIK